MINQDNSQAALGLQVDGFLKVLITTPTYDYG